VFTRGLLFSLPGLILGVLLAYISVAVLRNSLLTEEVAPLGVVALVTIAIVAIVLFATFGPARQAGATVPAPLLKAD
jgi:hypothetical protein